MIKVGLTGGIGSGKSIAAKIFETLGIPVYYADDAAKKLMHENQDLRAALIQHFGEAAYVDGQLNRPHISSIVFEDPAKLSLLNSLVHPLTLADAEDWINRQTTPYVIKEAALMFESDAWKQLDEVIGVSAPHELRLKRTMERDGISADAVQARMDKQMNEEEKMSRCDHVLINDEQQLLLPQVIALHEKLLKKAQLQGDG